MRRDFQKKGNASRQRNGEIRTLMWIQENGESIKYPKKLNPDRAEKRDKSKFCRFYDDYGHIIDEYRNLKDEIERLNWKGALRKFTRRKEDGRAKYAGRRNEFALKGKAKVEEDDDEPLRIINMITGDLKSIKDEKKMRKQISGEAKIITAESPSQSLITFNTSL